MPILTSILRVRQGWGRSIPTPGTLRIWDVHTSAVVNDIVIDDFCDIAFSGLPRTITLFMGGASRTYDRLTGTRLCEDTLPPSRNHQLGASWVHGGSLRFSKICRADGQPTITIYELRLASSPSPFVVESFPVPPEDGKFSFSPVSYHASFVTETGVTILDVRTSSTRLYATAPCPLYATSGRFSPDGRFLAYGTSENEICVWENTSAGYVTWGNLKPKLPFTGFAFSPVSTSTLSWGSEGIELLYPGNSTDGTHIATPRQEDGIISRTAIIDPSESYFYILIPALMAQQLNCWYRACILALKGQDTVKITELAFRTPRRPPWELSSLGPKTSSRPPASG